MVIDGGVSLEEFLGEGSNRLFINVWARTKNGKSFFPLSWPTPLHIFNFEPDGPLEAFRAAYRLGVIEDPTQVFIYSPIEEVMGVNESLVRDEGFDKPIYDWTIEVLGDVMKTDGGTVVFDTMDTFYQILRDVAMEDIRKKRERQGQTVQRFDWGMANKELKRLFDGIRANRDLNVLSLSQASPIFTEKGGSTGLYRNGGPAKLEQWVDVNARLQHDPDPDLPFDDAYNWCITFENARRNIGLRGQKLYAPTYDRIQAALDGDGDLAED